MPKPTRKPCSPPSTPSSRSETPRPYLSWSAFDLFRKSPEEYRNRYFRGRVIESEAMTLGKEVAEALESDKPEALDVSLAFVPKGKEMEKEISADCEGVPLYGRMDSFTEETLTLHEYKTGTVAWTQAKADKHGQLTFYALMIFLKHKKLPSNISLHWLPTERNESGRLALTGNIKSFITKRTLADLSKLAAEIPRVWAGIKEMYKEELNKIDL
jgi:hypothetical protein